MQQHSCCSCYGVIRNVVVIFCFDGVNIGYRLQRIMFIKRICSLSRTFYSPYRSPLTIGVSSNKFHLLRLSSSSTKQEENEPNPLVDKDRHINLIKLEIEVMRQNGKPLDINMIRKHHWDDLLMTKTKTARKRYYRYLFVREQTTKNKQVC